MKKLILASAAPLLMLGACEAVDSEADGADVDATSKEAAADMAAPATPGENDAELSIAENVAANEDLSSLNDAVVSAGLLETLGGVGPYTLFAPNNAAFQAANAGDLVESGGPQLVNLLSNHLVPGVVTTEDLRNAVELGDGSAELATMTGATLTVTADGDDLVISGGSGSARVTGADMAQSNGMIHVVDGVLQPG